VLPSSKIEVIGIGGLDKINFQNMFKVYLLAIVLAGFFLSHSSTLAVSGE